MRQAVCNICEKPIKTIEKIENTENNGHFGPMLTDSTTFYAPSNLKENKRMIHGVVHDDICLDCLIIALQNLKEK